MFYLTVHSTHFIYTHMVKDHSESERRNTLPPLHGLLFSISSKESFMCAIPFDRIAHTTTLVIQLWSIGWKSYEQLQVFFHINTAVIYHECSNFVSYLAVFILV